MRNIINIFFRDILCYSHKWRFLLFLLVIQVILIILTGGLRSGSANINVLVSFQSEQESFDPNEYIGTFDYAISELSSFSLQYSQKWISDPFNTLQEEHFDLILICNEDGIEIYTDETNWYRLNVIQDFVNYFLLYEDFDIHPFAAEMDQINTIMDKYDDVDYTIYYPAAQRQELYLLPKIVSILACFFPFLIASGSVIQEKNEHTLECVIVCLKSKWCHYIVGKELFPLFAGVMNFLVLILFSYSYYGLVIKNGLMGLLLLYVIAIYSSTILGLSASLAFKSQIQAFASSAFYLVCMVLFTGFIFPLESSALYIKAISNLFPLTFLLQPMHEWIISGIDVNHFYAELKYLFFQLIVFKVIAFASLIKISNSL